MSFAFVDDYCAEVYYDEWPAGDWDSLYLGYLPHFDVPIDARVAFDGSGRVFNIRVFGEDLSEEMLSDLALLQWIVLPAGSKVSGIRLTTWSLPRTAFETSDVPFEEVTIACCWPSDPVVRDKIIERLSVRTALQKLEQASFDVPM
jgi:hypothetical protein